MFDSFVTPGTVACQAPLSLGFSRQQYWSGLPFPSLGGLPDAGIEPSSPTFLAWQADSLLRSHGGSRFSAFPSPVSLIVSFAPSALSLSLLSLPLFLLPSLSSLWTL